MEIYHFGPISFWSKTNTNVNYNSNTNTYKELTLFRTKIICLHFFGPKFILDQNDILPKKFIQRTSFKNIPDYDNFSLFFFSSMQ
jgi:hypothetical protein